MAYTNQNKPWWRLYALVNCVTIVSHYSDVIMDTMVSQITNLTIIYSAVCLGEEIKENIKALRYWPLWGKFTGRRWIPHTKGQ